MRSVSKGLVSLKSKKVISLWYSGDSSVFSKESINKWKASATQHECRQIAELMTRIAITYGHLKTTEVDERPRDGNTC